MENISEILVYLRIAKIFFFHKFQNNTKNTTRIRENLFSVIVIWNFL